MTSTHTSNFMITKDASSFILSRNDSWLNNSQNLETNH